LSGAMTSRRARIGDRIGNSAYAFCAALAIAVSTACGAASAVESMSTFREIMVKGTKVGNEVQDYLRRNNPDAAMVVMSRHLREVDDTIKKVERDPAINGRHKVELLKQLTGYRRDLAQSRNAIREMSDLQSRFQRF
jgi:hypothetical protein